METYETEGILYARGWLFGVRDERGKLWSLSASLPPLNGKRVRIRVEVLEEGAGTLVWLLTPKQLRAAE